MTIEKKSEAGKLLFTLSGRLDTTTAPMLDSELQNLDDVTELTFDFAALEYLSSAGLRVLLATQKTMQRQGEMVILNANNSIKEVFDVTGFSDVFTVK